MQNDADLPFDLSDDMGPSRLPWVVAGLTLGLALFSFSADARRIPERIQARGEHLLEQSRLPGLSLAVDGRDISVGGEVGPEVDRATLLARLRNIPGVRKADDRLSVIDPAVEAAARAAAFRNSVARIDTSGISFELGSTELSASSRQPLAEVAQLLKANPQQRVRISGHTDNVGRPEVNVRISRERAQSVADTLKALGVPPAQMLVRGYGSAQPIADNNTDAGRARNRRIDISAIE